MPQAKRGILSATRIGKRLWYGLILACTLNLGCQPIDCTTPAGMVLVTETFYSGQCSRYAEVEARIIQKLGDSERLRNVSIVARPESAFVDPWGRYVGGYALCKQRQIVVGSGKTAFAHEIIHIWQNCQARQPPDFDEDIDHANWKTDGFYQLIEEASK